ncbi:MAG: hypothetical protein HC903_17655 [Methylacidiphilales bacterium]|nr:hypothetical protein [Candidatus Methylacidiphilales bacterium]NJR18082.1 hypothetical protein [Calothrix sp. CSU_2_0]
MLNPTTISEAASETTSPQRLTELANTHIELARIVAANVVTPPQLLQELSRRKDIGIKIAVASNPNTSTHILFSLGKDFPEEVLNNPIFPILLLENLNLLENIPLQTLESFLKSPIVPNSFIDWVINNRANYDSLLIAIATNPQASKHILNQILSRASQQNLSPNHILNQILSRASKQNISPNHILILQAVEAASLHVKIAGEMAKGWDEAALSAIRSGKFLDNNPQQEKLLSKLHIIPKFTRIKKYIPLINLIFTGILKILKIRKVQIFLLILLVTPLEITKILLAITLQMIFFGLFAQFVNVLIRLIALFSYCFSIIFLCIIFLYNQYKLAIQKYTLYQQHKNNLKTHHKNNLKTNQSYKKEWQKVNNIESTKTILSELANSPWLFIRESLIKHPNTDSEILNTLSNAEPKYLSTSLLLKIIQHPEITSQILVTCAKSTSNEVTIAVAKNLKTPISTLSNLWKHNEKFGKTSTVAIANILQRNPQLAGKLLAKFVKSATPSIPKLYLLLHPIAPSHFLCKHSSSLDWRERYAVAQNPNTPQHIREKLTEDANRIVRATAKANL